VFAAAVFHLLQAGTVILGSRAMSPKLKKFIQSWVINTLAVLIAVYVVPGIHFKDETSGEKLFAALMTALVLGVLNAFIRPVLMLFALPVIVFTLGLFMLVINVLMLLLAEWAAPHLSIDGFWTYIGTVVIIWLVNWVGYTLVDELEGSRRQPALT